MHNWPAVSVLKNLPFGDSKINGVFPPPIQLTVQFLDAFVGKMMSATQATVDTPTATSTVTQPTPVASTADVVKPVKQTRKEKVTIAIPESLDSTVTVPKPQVEKAIKQPKPVPEPWPEVPAPKGIRVIKTYADGSQILDDGKERWLNADWTQPVKYVCS